MFHLIVIIFTLIKYCQTIRGLKIISGGGHSIQLCLIDSRSPHLERTHISNCTETSKKCTNDNYTGEYFHCNIPCGFKFQKVKIMKVLTPVSYVRLDFKIKRKSYQYKSLQKIIIDSNPTVLSLLTNEIEILFSKNISCSKIKIMNESIECVLNKFDMQFNKELHVNVSVKYGIGCHPPKFIASIQISRDREWTFYILIPIPFICLILITLAFLPKNKRFKATYEHHFQKQMNERQDKFILSQKKALLEYQKGINSFSHLGRLTPRHMRSFHDYMNRTFNVDFQRKLFDDPSDKSQYFESMLLNKFQLIEWVSKIESVCSIRERELIASFLTVYLFKFPIYFLDLMKTMLIQLIFEEKKNTNERMLFTETQSITELIVINWLSMCMYENFKTGKEGEKLFNLYRVIKCTMNSGLVDDFSKKAKYVLSTNNILTTNLEYDLLKVVVNVDILLKLNAPNCFLPIVLKNMDLIILSLDTVSQVKEKIIDQAITSFSENENCSFPDGDNDLTISSINIDHFHLFLKHHNVKLLLSNFDNTSITSDVNKRCIIANTMKHYNIKSESTLLLTSVVQSTCYVSSLDNNQDKVHLLIAKENVENEILDYERDIQKPIAKNLVFKPSIDNENTDAYLMLLLATKNNLDLFVIDLFQCIFDWYPNEEIMTSFMNSSQAFQENDLIQINYLFSIFDNIAVSISLESVQEVQMWKRNSIINLFWCKIINDPSLIFSVDLNTTIRTSLNVISKILQLSCSNEISDWPEDKDVSVHMFLQDIQSNYSHWWDSFINSRRSASDEDMEKFMKNIVEKYQLHQFNAFILNNLKVIGRNLLIK